VRRALAASTSTSPIGLAGALGAPAATLAIAGRASPRSSIVPQPWHSGHRPTHLATSYPHSPQRYVAPFFAMGQTLARGYDNARLEPHTQWSHSDSLCSWVDRGSIGASVGMSNVIAPAFLKVKVTSTL
jgi:hypothetical protein